MIGIEVITGRFNTIGPRLEDFYNEHSNIEVISSDLRGIEGGKGLILVLKYDKKAAPKPKTAPKPKKAEKTPEQLEREAKKAQLEKLKTELEEEE